MKLHLTSIRKTSTTEKILNNIENTNETQTFYSNENLIMLFY